MGKNYRLLKALSSIKNMFTVGITGGIATGKSLATNFFSAKGIEVIDADKISRSLQEPGQAGYEAIVKKFGAAVLSKDQTIIRSKLRTLAFSNKDTKKWLEDLMHPMIGQKVLEGAAHQRLFPRGILIGGKSVQSVALINLLCLV